ncbi:chorismate synthase [bacterium]|nr:chorismate synthase [bacterium]
MSNTFGHIFRVTTFGESHCKAVGAVVDGCPPRMELSEGDIQPQLNRRRPGQNDITTPRQEKDCVILLSGVENGLTLGTPIAMMVENQDQRPGDYQEINRVPRPSHADYTVQIKYGIRTASGGGRASARETVGRVAAGAVAEKILKNNWGVEIVAWVSQVGDVAAPDLSDSNVTREMVDQLPVRCPDHESAERMAKVINEVKIAKDSVGGIVTCICRQIPAGWGEPVFGKLDARLAQAMLSIPAVKGFEVGSGFQAAAMRGSQHNDLFIQKGDRLGTITNNSGGIQGGISNGEPIVFRVAFKPAATLGQPQKTVDFNGKETILNARGRHDPCVVPRAVPVVESMAALVLVDCGLYQRVIQ